MLSQSDFRPVTLEDRDLFRDFFRRFPQEHSDNLFTTMVCWNHYANYSFAEAGDAIILATTIGGQTTYRAPTGPRDPALLREVVALAAEEGGDEQFLVFGKETVEWVKSEIPTLTLQPDRDFFDYIYLSSALATLPGSKYLSIRRQINKFRRKCNYTLDPMTPDLRGEVCGFLEEWCEWKKCEEQPILEYEKDAVLYAITHFDYLGLEGLLIRVDGSISGMAVFTELNPETVVVHFEKALPECKGVYKALNQETASLLQSRYRFINRESDLGVPGLRETKTRYGPHHFAEVYSAKKEALADF